MDQQPNDWPAHSYRTVPWRQSQRQGPREDRTVTDVLVALPPRIGHRTVAMGPDTVVAMEDASRQITTLDTSAHASYLQALSRLLLRTESVASSKIEHIEASTDDYARAMHGSKANASAVAIVAATEATQTFIDRAGRTGGISLELLTDAHRMLMGDDPFERAYAGKLRDMQNWIGGSDYSPRGALYVPPPPEAAGEYMDDLVTFSNRTDVPVLAQAAIAHAQFESIHPFTDGNGRIGRALINAILRRRGLTSRVVIPIASALVAHRERYFSLLDGYRAGNARAIVEAFANASRIAAEEAHRTAQRLVAIPPNWARMLGGIRKGSAVERALPQLAANPVVSVEDVIEFTGSSQSSAYQAVERLVDADVLKPLTTRRRNQIWGASAILDELADLGLRIETRARQETGNRQGRML